MPSKTTHSPLENYGLHKYALLGDDDGVRRSLEDGADINGLDSAGRTVIMCAVAGENWQNMDAYDASFMSSKRLNALKILLNHPDISLLTMNFPHSSMNGVIPLCMAAWLNLPEAVRVLLEESVDSVSVDGMDAHGATALMYAARDGSLDVVRVLLSHGARPDFRDRNDRTSIQFSLAHPQILWLCETVLRRHRWREIQSANRIRLSEGSERLIELAGSSLPFSEDLSPPPLSIFTQESTSRLTNTLISCIRSADVTFMHSLLFSPPVPASSPPALYPMSVPVLVNMPDSNGWSLVHHCCAQEWPSVDILDTLYCVGADVACFTTQEQQTPLHILARFPHFSSSSSSSAGEGEGERAHSLKQFTLHLIHDLRSPLSARDKDDETCLHIAAEHGHSASLLSLLIDCDSNGVVRRMKNSRGLTPLEVCKKDFLHVFGVDENKQPLSATSSSSSSSNYPPFRPSDSFTSLASLSDLNSLINHTITNDGSSIYASPSEFDVITTTHQLLSNLRATSLTLTPQSTHAHVYAHPAHIEYLEDRLEETTAQCNSIVVHFRSRIEEADRCVRDLKRDVRRIEEVRGVVGRATRGRLVERGIRPVRTVGRRQRESQDSQTTVAVLVEEEEEEEGNISPSSSSNAIGQHAVEQQQENKVSIGVQTTLLDAFVANNTSSLMATAAPDSGWMDRFIRSPDSGASRAHFSAIWDAHNDLFSSQARQQASTPTQTPTTARTDSTIKGTKKLKEFLKKKKLLEEKIQDMDAAASSKKESLSGTARVKAWIRRMVVPQAPSPRPKLELVLDLDEHEDECRVGREVKRSGSGPAFPAAAVVTGDVLDGCVDHALQTSQVVLENAQRDLLSVQECLAAAEQFIDLANHSISRTQRIVKRAIKKREAMINDLRSSTTTKTPPHSPTSDSHTLSPVAEHFSPGMLGYTTAISTRPSLASISTIYSTTSSILSVAATLTDNNNDDEDTRIIRRLLLRKIEAQTSGAWDEVDRAVGWLKIVKEAVRSVKRRAYL